MDRVIFEKLSKYFIGVIRFGLGIDDVLPEKEEDFSWGQVYALAKRHSLTALVLYSLNKGQVKIEESVKTVWRKENDISINADINQLYSYEEIKESFTENNISFLPLKGIYIKKLYPETYLRQMGDLDILYQRNDFEKVVRILEELGYEFDQKTTYSNHQIFKRGSITEIEMHSALLPSASPYKDYYNDVWEKRAQKAEDGCVFSFSLEDEYIFLLIHGAKHLFRTGSGVRTIIDFYLYLNKYEKDLDRNYINSELTKLKEFDQKEDKSIDLYEKIIKRLIDLWFGKEIVLDDVGLERISDGVYGTIEKVWETEYGRHKSKAGWFLYRMFLPYSQMVTAYPVLKKLPFLLPFFWIVRLIGAIFTKPKKVREEMKHINQFDAQEKKKRKKEKKKKVENRNKK